MTTTALPVARHARQHQRWTATAPAETHSLGGHRRSAPAPTARMRDLAVAFSQQPAALSSLWRIQTLATSATALTGHSSPCVRSSPVGPSAVPFAATPLPLIGPHRPQSPPSCPQTTAPLNLLSPLSAQAQGVDEPLTANPRTRMGKQEDLKANQWTRFFLPRASPNSSGSVKKAPRLDSSNAN